MTVLLSFFESDAARLAAVAVAKAICKATGGYDYGTGYGQRWDNWVNEHLASAKKFTKKLAIKAGKAICKSL